MTAAAPAPADLRAWGIDPAWSRLVDVPGRDGVRRWHVLDRAAASGAPPRPTLVCVHGNPTWAGLWQPFLDGIEPTWRVVAPDQLGMGWSERTPARRYAERVDDLDALLAALGVDGPVVLAAHDWGGAIAMGWAVRHPTRVAGLVLVNTGIAVPAGRRAPSLIRLAASRGVRDLVCRRTPTFVEGTLRLSRDRLTATHRSMLRAPYRHRSRRPAIADFVADVPFDDTHPSAAAIADVAERVRELDVPVLLAWGDADPVFDDDFCADLAGRMPHADVHRFPGCGHLVVLEADVAGVADTWLRQLDGGSRPNPAAGDEAAAPFRPVWSALEARRDDGSVAVVDGATGDRESFAALASRVDHVAATLRSRGVAPGDRVAVLVPPGIDLVALVYACWRIGAVTVVADRGLGLRGLRRAIRGARVAHVVGPARARRAAAVLRWAPRARHHDVAALRPPGGSPSAPLDAPAPGPDDLAAVLFTSGATGPAKGVRYTHRQFAAQRDALAATYGITADDRFVAAFAPFALYGPALGIASAVPDVDVTRPATLTAAALDDACRALGATMVFASPSALANVVATAGDGGHAAVAQVRTIMSAGAPVPVRTLRAMRALAPAATLHTPYGMTEALPVADVDLDAIEAALADPDGGRGVCVGAPVPGCRVLIAPLAFDAEQPVEAVHVGVTGEVLVAAPWVSDGYDRLWAVEAAARPAHVTSATSGERWHRTGDVGHLDATGRLWIEGRSAHVIWTATGAVTPVPVEIAAESVDGVGRAAAVGIGPHGAQQVAVVVEDGGRGLDLADLARTAAVRDAVRSATGVPVAAVVRTGALPVDIRHNAKIDRTAVATDVARLLAGSA